VDVSPVQRGPEPTTLAVATLDDGGSAAYSFYVEGTADRLFTVPERLPEGTRAVSFGTCSLVLEPGASAYEELLREAHGRGLFTALDPNIRAGLIANADAYRARFRGWLPSVTLLKLSAEDAEWLGGTPREWLDAGPAAVVVTHGGDGLTAFVREAGGVDAVYVAPGEKVDVVDTIGAGDTVNAALLHGLAAREALSAAAVADLGPDGWRHLLGFAARAAALTCSRAGAEPPWSAELTGGRPAPRRGRGTVSICGSAARTRTSPRTEFSRAPADAQRRANPSPPSSGARPSSSPPSSPAASPPAAPRR
jgi:fructokinase